MALKLLARFVARAADLAGGSVALSVDACLLTGLIAIAGESKSATSALALDDIGLLAELVTVALLRRSTVHSAPKAIRAEDSLLLACFVTNAVDGAVSTRGAVDRVGTVVLVGALDCVASLAALNNGGGNRRRAAASGALDLMALLVISDTRDRAGGGVTVTQNARSLTGFVSVASEVEGSTGDGGVGLHKVSLLTVLAVEDATAGATNDVAGVTLGAEHTMLLTRLVANALNSAVSSTRALNVGRALMVSVAGDGVERRFWAATESSLGEDSQGSEEDNTMNHWSRG